MINHADTGSVVDPESGLRPALVLFDGLNEQTFWLWVRGGFINLLGEVVKMQFCCSLAFP